MLDPTRVLTLAGQTVPDAPAGPTATQLAAVAFAEATIRAYTRATWLASGDPAEAFELRVRLDARAYALRLPHDVVAVSAVAPTPESRFALFLAGGRLELFDAALVQVGAWEEGVYLVTGTRGFTADDRVEKAASLLVAYYLRLSDPERSAYAQFSEGDFSGAWKLARLSVPEAETLLRPFVVGAVLGGA